MGKGWSVKEWRNKSMRGVDGWIPRSAKHSFDPSN